METLSTLNATAEPWMAVSSSNAWPSPTPQPLITKSKTKISTPAATQWTTSWEVPAGIKNVPNTKKTMEKKKEIILVTTPSSNTDVNNAPIAPKPEQFVSSLISNQLWINKDSKNQNPWEPVVVPSPTSTEVVPPTTTENDVSKLNRKSPVPVPVPVPAIIPPEEKHVIEDELSKQNLYKTELCRSFMITGICRYGHKCQFAHGEHELRPVMRHPKYKTETCKTFATTGHCPYGNRCRFIHPEGIDQLNSNEESTTHQDFQSPTTTQFQQIDSNTFFQSPMFTPSATGKIASSSNVVPVSLTTTPANSPKTNSPITFAITNKQSISEPKAESTDQTAKGEDSEEEDSEASAARRLSFFQRLTIN